MEDEVCGRGKRVKRVIVCRNGWHNCCLPAFEKINPCSTTFKSSPSTCKAVPVASVHEAPKDVPQTKGSKAYKASRQPVVARERERSAG